jgi:hypothetical protein
MTSRLEPRPPGSSASAVPLPEEEGIATSNPSAGSLRPRTRPDAVADDHRRPCRPFLLFADRPGS